MESANFEGILLLTRIGNRVWKNFCESVAKKDDGDTNTFDLALETIAALKRDLEFSGKIEQRRQRRLRAAMIYNTKTNGMRIEWDPEAQHVLNVDGVRVSTDLLKTMVRPDPERTFRFTREGDIVTVHEAVANAKEK